jgi:Kef-type K+ transport system membrane component KefB
MTEIGADLMRAAAPAEGPHRRPAGGEALRGVEGHTRARAVGVGAALLVFVLASPAGAAGPGEAAHFGPILFGLAVLVVVAKIGGVLTQRMGQPAVLGELLAGVAIGNLLPFFFGSAGIAFVRSEPTLLFLAQLGVLILLFDVGLEADLRALIRAGWPSMLVAVVGIIAPLLLGWGAMAWLMPGSPTLAHLFVGATLSATSVGITARVLKDLGVGQTREGQIILGAAVVDDILGVVVLAAISGAVVATATGGRGISALAIAGLLIRAVLFLVVTLWFGGLCSGPVVRLAARTGQPGMLLVVGLALCFTLAYAAELVGLPEIVGAFAAGLFLDPYGQGVRTGAEEASLSELIYPFSAFFVPLFFVLMGIQVHLGSLSRARTLLLAGVLVLCAVAGKLACAVGVPGRGLNRAAIGIGMVPRGEVGLIFAGIGANLTLQGQPVLAQEVFSAIVLVVLVTTLLAPIGLRWAFARPPGG